MIDEVKIFLVDNVEVIEIISKLLVKIEDYLADCLLLDKQIEIWLVLKGTFRPAAVVSDEEHQKGGQLVAVAVSNISWLAICQIANLSDSFFFLIHSDPMRANSKLAFLQALT